MELPTDSFASELGEKGITILKKFFQDKFNWIFRPNHREHDFGIDAYIDIKTELRQLTGKTIAAQVKTGQSYFKETNDFGWIYRGEMSHLNYYLNHDIPVIIILVDEGKKKSFWCYCDPQKTQKAGSSWKITIPFHQELSSSSKNELLKYVSPLRDYVSQLDHFWAMNNKLKQTERLIFAIDKEQIIKKSYVEIIAGLNRIQVNPDLIKSLKEKVEISIDGYDRDPRELYEIQEVTNWAKMLFANTSGLSYFLTKDKHSQFFKVLIFCYMMNRNAPKKYYKENNTLRVNIELDLTDRTFFDLAFNDLNDFTEKHNLSEEINKEISRNIGNAILGKLAP